MTTIERRARELVYLLRQQGHDIPATSTAIANLDAAVETEDQSLADTTTRKEVLHQYADL